MWVLLSKASKATTFELRYHACCSAFRSIGVASHLRLRATLKQRSETRNNHCLFNTIVVLILAKVLFRRVMHCPTLQGKMKRLAVVLPLGPDRYFCCAHQPPCPRPDHTKDTMIATEGGGSADGNIEDEKDRRGCMGSGRGADVDTDFGI